MNDPRIQRGSRKLSWLLRHGARESGLAMDAAGWAAVADVLALAGLSRAELERIVAENNKARYQLAGERVRATQGHSQAGTPVTHNALEASWERLDADPGIPVTGSAWHGTRCDEELLATIGSQGLLPGARTHVHLADGPDSTVGKRAQVGVLLEVSRGALAAAGIHLFRSPNGVLLARRVPPTCLVDLRPLTQRARQSETRLRAALGLWRRPRAP